MASQKVDNTLLQYLMPDLANMVFEYCWKADAGIYDACLYGDYEKILTFDFYSLNMPPPANASSNMRIGWYPCTLTRNIVYSSNINIARAHMGLPPITHTEWGAKKNAFNAACESGYVEIVKYILYHSGWRNAWYGINEGMFCACKARHRDIVIFLMERGANDCLCLDQNDCLYMEISSVKGVILHYVNKIKSMFSKL